MKAFRRVYYPVMAACLIAGLYTGLRLFFIIFLTQAIAVAAMVAINIWTFYSFTYKQELSQKVCVKGDDVKLHLEITNERPIPLSLIEVHVDVVSVKESVDLMFSLAPFSGQAFEIPVAVPYRGCYSVGMTKLKITDIFGLATVPFDMRRLFFYHAAELVVLPKAAVPQAISYDVSDTKFFGAAYLRHAEQGESISGARLYQDGDPLRRVNWKKSAQLGRLFVKQYEYPEREHILIAVDTGLHGLSGEEGLVYADTVCECAACIALHSLSKNRSVGVLGGAAVSLKRCDSLHDFDTLRRYLAALRFTQSADIGKLVAGCCSQAGSARSLFLVTRKMTPDLSAMLCGTLAARIPVTAVLVGGRAQSAGISVISVEPGSDAAASLGGLSSRGMR